MSGVATCEYCKAAYSAAASVAIFVCVTEQSWARDNFLASGQRQRDNVTEPQGPVRDQKKFEK